MREDASSRMATTQVSEVPLGELSRYEPSSHKRARVTTDVDTSRGRAYGGVGNQAEFLPAWHSRRSSRSSGGANNLSPVPELPRAPAAAAAKAAAAIGRGHRGDGSRNRDPRSASPTPSYASSSTFSAATTTATTLSSRASLSSCRPSFAPSSPTYSSYRRGGGGGGRYSGRTRSHCSSGFSSSSSSSSSSPSSFGCSRSSFSSSRQAQSATSGGGSSSSCADFFPKPSSSWSGSGSDGVGRRRRGSPETERRRDGSRDRYVGSGSSRSSRDRHYGCPPPGRRSSGVHKDYAREADNGSAGRKRNRSSSRERGSGSCSSRRSAPESGSSGVECARCLEWCRYSRAQQRQPITRTLQMDYYVRTPRCKVAKTKHIDFIDDVAYSREQFIEETVFTCPFTGARRDTVLERNMFPYDVPTDVEHWTLWSRKDLSEGEMEAFVQSWAAENHPHAVEWECDNNEGERSIDWFHVHVFFRLGCEDRTGVPRDPDSVYDGPYQRKDDEDPAEDGEEVGQDGTGAYEAEAGGGGGAGDGEDNKEEEEEQEQEAETDHE